MFLGYIDPKTRRNTVVNDSISLAFTRRRGLITVQKFIMPTTILNKIKSTIEKYNMLQKNDKVLVGVSGGPDSITLLHILNSLKKEYLVDIVVAHLDHKFRGEESSSDRIFCEGLAKKYGLEIVFEEIDVPKIAKEKGISPEEAARFERYDFFKRTAKERGIKRIAVGHTRAFRTGLFVMVF